MTDHEHTPPTEAELDEWDKFGEDNERVRLIDPANLVDPDCIPAFRRLIREVRRLRAERSADSERLDWLDGLGFMDNGYYKRWHLASPPYVMCSVREAIDAARQEPTP